LYVLSSIVQLLVALSLTLNTLLPSLGTPRLPKPYRQNLGTSRRALQEQHMGGRVQPTE
jgi:hypothetical protein